jgi:PAS domain S-box-containing protein
MTQRNTDGDDRTETASAGMLDLEELGAADHRFRRMVERLPAIVYIETGGHPGPTIYISPRIKDVLGYAPEDFLRGKNSLWAEVLHPDDVESTHELDGLSERTKEPYVADYRLRARDGRWVWFHDEAVFVPADDEMPAHWQGVMIDITEQKRLEQELHDSAATFKALVGQLPALVYIESADDDEGMLYVSPQYERWFGYSPEERLADPGLWGRLLHPDDRDRVHAAADRAAGSGGTFAMDYRMVARDGRVVWVHDETYPILDEQGRERLWLGVMFDVTERKLQEVALRDTATKYRTLIEQIPAITYIDPLEPEPIASLYVSPQIEAMAGVSPEEAAEDPEWWVKAVHPDDRSEAVEASDRADETGEPFRHEYRMVARDGRVVWVRDEADLIRDPTGKPLYWHGVISDITERKRGEQDLERALRLERDAAEQLRRADELKNMFLQAVSHDLRSPLTAMLGSALTLEREDELGLQAEDRRDLIHGMVNKTKKLVAIVSDLLDLERLSGGHLEPNRSTQDVGKLVARVVAESDVLEGRPVHVDTEPVRLPVDTLMVERIVENLLANAAKHAPTETTVWVRVRSQPDGAVISVEDNGPGIAPDRHDQIFAAFERGAEESTNVPGVGLGLSLVLRFAALHGGRAWVEDREGGGASFRVFLPAGDAGELSSSRDRAASA